MNVAILIGNSEYENENKLPACKKDLEVIESIIKKSGKYDEIYTFSEYKSIELKNNLSDKIKNLKKSEISEVFIYYTGHGLYRDDQFYYIPVDYDQKKHNVTSFANEEFDNLIRTLSPDLTIKLIDACESSQNYIKMLNEEKEHYLKGTKQGFKNCYFMYSSLNNQASYQDNDLSYFTKAFYESLVNHHNNSIRYKDITSYISDYFLSDKVQTPFFITQASFTEIFLDNLDIVRKKVLEEDNLIPLKDTDSEKLEDTTNKKSLLAKIAEDAKLYLEKDTAISYLESLAIEMKKMKLNDIISDYFDLKTSEINEIKTIKGIEKTFKEISAQKIEWFIDIETEAEEYEVEVEVPKKRNPNSLLWTSALSMFDTYQEYDLKTVTRTREKITGFEHSIKTPFSGFSLTLIPKYPNLDMYTCNLFFIFNKRDFLLFSNKVVYKDKNWGQWIVKELSSWEKRNYLFSNTEKITEGLVSIFQVLQDEVYEEIQKKYISGD